MRSTHLELTIYGRDLQFCMANTIMHVLTHIGVDLGARARESPTHLSVLPHFLPNIWVCTLNIFLQVYASAHAYRLQNDIGYVHICSCIDACMHTAYPHTHAHKTVHTSVQLCMQCEYLHV